jgi:phospholipase/carboxylesterase
VPRSQPPSAAGRLLSRPLAPAPGPALPEGLHPLEGVGLPEHLLLVPAGTSSPAPLVIWFHGAGGNAARSLSALRDVAARHGTLLLVPSSRDSTWDLLTGALGRDVSALDVALAHVFASCAVSRVAFAGFSDGASYALSLGLASGDLAEAVLAFSPGFLAPPAVVGKPRCWVAHGTQDTVLPIDRCGRRVVEQLRRAWYDVRYEEFGGPHVVRPDLLDEAVRWWLAGEAAA